MVVPTVIVPGYFARGTEYTGLAAILREKGIPVSIVPLRKRDWIPTIGGRSIVPILRLLDKTVKQALAEHNAEQVNLVGHSAGGWISRIYLGEKPYTIHGDVTEDEGVWHGRERTAKLICLGTPQTSQERWTKRNLDFVNQSYPGAFYPQVKYVCVAGKAVYGQRRLGSWLAYSSYEITCGVGNCWGDGITPIVAAHLEGAENLTLEGVYHSPQSPGKWYGTAEVIEEWVGYLEN
ncbi:hypothetical protein PN462_20025 [Spirulina sp. CS-785/01]|uniref:esterase/lipase family protein n=1 Tax=Spirulina sp. CS-785/01 TaxID=3021716 RepID=UPI00232F770A|nr:hypothetical protein [Spirulina sp. CS-785/01]MDB9315413.1 hypothetical protein [Spirulina sp. CS-785/01]